LSRSTVRAGIATWIDQGAIVGLNKLRRSEPINFWGPEFIPDGDLSGSVAYVHIDVESEHRISGPAQQPGVSPPSGAGWKEVTYSAALVIMFRSVRQDENGEDDPGELAMDDFDDQIEAIKARVRSDNTLGGVVFSAGEGGARGQDDMTVRADMPVRSKGTVHIKAVIEFVVTEWIQA
jgi:hypothetical protein